MSGNALPSSDLGTNPTANLPAPEPTAQSGANGTAGQPPSAPPALAATASAAPPAPTAAANGYAHVPATLAPALAACRCGRPWAPAGERCTGGHPRPGLAGPAYVHGRRSEVARRLLEDDAAAGLREHERGIITDLGGDGAVSVVAGDLVTRYVRASALLEWMERELVTGGPLTSRGRRRALHGAYLAQLDRVTNLARLLGLERRAKPPRPLADAVRDMAAANRGQQA